MMVDTQVRPSDVTKFPIIEAMLTVEREAFVPASKKGVAYSDGNIDLGDGRTLLEPRSLAKMLDALDLQKEELALDIGCGLGYSSAVLSRICEAVVAVEESNPLAQEAQGLLSQHGADNVAVIVGELAAGVPQHGPYDVIVVQGGVSSIPPAIEDQLKDGGRIAAIFMQGALGECRIGYKSQGKLTWRMSFNASAPVLKGFESDIGFQL